VNIRDLFNQFFPCFSRFIGNATRIAKKAYRDIRWEYYTRKCEKIPVAFGTEWIRQPKQAEWLLFVAHDVKAEFAVQKLLDHYWSISKPIIGKVGEYNTRFIKWYAPFVKLGFGFTEDMIEYAITGKPNARNN
jgi:hypothetical protein